MSQFEDMLLAKDHILRTTKKIKNEDKLRKELLHLAKLQGCEAELRQIFQRYDTLLKSCQNAEEAQQIGIMGVAEVHKLLNMQGALNVNGFEILPSKSNQ